MNDQPAPPFDVGVPGATHGANRAADVPARPNATPGRGGGAARRRKRNLIIAKWCVGVAALVPVARLGWQFATEQLGANPIAEAMNQLGLWTLILLLASLALTPIKIMTGWTWPVALRRLVGLLAFATACLHFGVYLGVDQFFDFNEIGRDIVKRKFITVGFAALVLLIPLAVTSTSGMLKRLGARRWKRLHRLVYVAAVLGVIHFVWRVKSDLREPLIYAGVLAVLFGVRGIEFVRRRFAGMQPR
jgi:sulfoxide reductase heme-binding subunit YedZ